MLNENQQKEFLSLFEPVRSGLLRYARGLTRNNEDARDLVSDTVLAAIDGFDRLKKKESFKSYVFTIATRIFRRQKSRRRFFATFNEEQAERIPDNNSKPDSLADVGALYSAMAKLPAKQHEAIALFELSGLTIEEIKNIQGGTISGVKSRLKRGREQLAYLLGANDLKRLSYQSDYNQIDLNVFLVDSNTPTQVAQQPQLKLSLEEKR